MNAKLVSNVVRCLCSVVFLVTCSTSARTEAASYQKTDGTIVAPILETSGRLHEEYSGNNLEPYADLTNASLSRAVLADANLTSADLTRADLANADLANADLYRAKLQYADLTLAGLRHADLYRVNLTGANLTWATLQHAVLLTFTGFHAPFSPAVVTNKQEEGPILTVIDACQVDRVFLISTSNTAEITQLTKEAIEEKNSDVATEIITTSIDDPY